MDTNNDYDVREKDCVGMNVIAVENTLLALRCAEVDIRWTLTYFTDLSGDDLIDSSYFEDSDWFFLHRTLLDLTEQIKRHEFILRGLSV